MSTFERQMEQGRMYARLPAYGRALAYAEAGIAAMLALCPRTYVSLSFGKQSQVVAHMVYQVAPETPMRFLAGSETWIVHNFGDVIDRFLRQCPVRLTIRQTNDAAIDISVDIAWLQERHPSIQWEYKPPGDPTWTWAEVRAAGQDDLPTLGDRTLYDGWFWGLASEESQVRRMSLAQTWEGQPHPTIFRYSDGKFRCCPLRRWHVDELAAYIATHNLPMLDAYHFEGLDTRTTARVRSRAVGMGLMAQTRHYNLHAANQLFERFPELRAYT